MGDQQDMIAFMQRFSFATIVSTKNNVPTATHLPFLVEFKNNKVKLTAHFAKANDHWKHLENQTVLVIFIEPHAYISTRNYDLELNVPTWNYLSIHAYGTATVITDYQQSLNVLERTIKNFEPSYLEKWNDFPKSYKLKMTNGIVAFEITVTELQAKEKLSQNRTETEKNKIIDSLLKGNSSNEQIIAEYMEKASNQLKQK